MKCFFIFMAVIMPQITYATVYETLAQNSLSLKELYRGLHETPELSGQEKLTAEKMAAEFKKLGLEVHEKLGVHGVVGVLKNGSGSVTWVRAELDALPVKEETGVTFKSKNEGKMHACGHDFHMTSLVGIAQAFAKNKQEWTGTIVFIAQPAEETVDGAAGMIRDGLLKKVPKPNQLLALHTTALVKKGLIGVTPGYALANVDSVNVTFKGKGAHGSAPENGIDPFVQAAEFTLKLQTLLGREKKAREPAVISVGSIHGGTKHNIIPDEVKMQVTVRTYKSELRKLLKRRIAEIAAGIARTNAAPAPQVEFLEGADATYNDIVLSRRMKEAFENKLGKAAVIESDPIMGSEDFGQFGIAAKAPSLFFWVGEQNPKDPSISNHSPKYLPDYDKTAPLAMQAMAAGILELHKK